MDERLIAMRLPDTEYASTTAGRVRPVALPSAARALSMLSRIDYHDAFTVDAGPGQERTGEQWARTILEDAPEAMRRTLLNGWHRLGLDLGSPGSPDRVLGWEIRRNTPDCLLLDAGSPLGLRGELLFWARPGGLLTATFIEQRNVAARALWAPIVPQHQQIVRSLLTQAIGRM
jgi:hypothetical protein